METRQTLPLETDHTGLNKFTDPEGGYRHLWKAIENINDGERALRYRYEHGKHRQWRSDHDNHRLQGNYEAAVELDRRMLTLMKSKLGETDSTTLAAMASLSVILREHACTIYDKEWDVSWQNHDTLREAERLASEALVIQRRVLGGNHVDTLASQEVLASILWHLDGRDEAERIMQVLRCVRENQSEERQPVTLRTMATLASMIAVNDQSRLAEVEDLEMTVYEARKNMLGSTHPDMLSALRHLNITRADVANRNADWAQRRFFVCIHRADLGFHLNDNFKECLRYLAIREDMLFKGPPYTQHAPFCISLMHLRLYRWKELVLIDTRFNTEPGSMMYEEHEVAVPRAEERKVTRLNALFQEISDIFKRALEDDWFEESGEAGCRDRSRSLQKTLAL